MKGKEKQRREPVALKKTKVSVSSSDDEDSDVERNFALLRERGGGGEEEEQCQEEEYSGEDGERSDEGEEDYDGKKEEDEGEDQEKDGATSGDEDEDEDEDDDDDDDDDDEEQEDAGGSSEIKTREDIKNELSSMSFEDIMKLQNQVGTKVYNEVAYGGSSSSSKPVESRKKKRLNKNRPMEISSKRPAPFLRQVVPVRKATHRDPRFDDLSGEYKPEIFEKTYKFINDIKQKEKEVIQKKLKKTKKNEKGKEKLVFLLKRMENQERARKSREQQRERELQFKREQRERANQGNRPFFLKNSEKKKLQLAEKYQELKKSGKVENFLSKKRKRNAGKDRRKLPRQLQSQKTA